MSAWEEVDQWREKQVSGDVPRTAPAPKVKAVFRAMTVGEELMALALGGCRFSPGTFDKRFARDVAWQATQEPKQITEKQAALLRKMITRYRRQIRAGSLASEDRALLSPPVTKGSR